MDKNKENIEGHIENNQLILVDKDDNILGYQSKEKCHEHKGILHRAFSIFLFNEKKQLLLQKRSEKKLLWPLYWSNSVCSHPRKGESIEKASIRRLNEELGVSVPLEYVFKFKYHAEFKDFGSEYELCSVFIGKIAQDIFVDEDEIAEWKFVDLSTISQEIEQNSNIYTPWFKIEWKILQSEYSKNIELMLNK